MKKKIQKKVENKTFLATTSKKIVFCDNVQCDKKCDVLVQCVIKMVQSDKIVVNHAS